MYLAGIITRTASIDGALAARSRASCADGRTFSYLLLPRRGATLQITQNDVRAIQLAKAALYAGVRLLMDTSASTRSTASASPAPSAATSTSNTRWCWA